MPFGKWHEAYLEIVANRIALVLDRIIDRCNEPESVAPGMGPQIPPTRPARSRSRAPRSHRLTC